MLQCQQACENRENIPELTPTLESAVGRIPDLGRKTQAKAIYKIKLALRVQRANHVACATFPGLQGYDRIFDTLRGEIPEERVSCSQGQKTKSNSCGGRKRLREEPIQDFEGISVSAHS